MQSLADLLGTAADEHAPETPGPDPQPGADAPHTETDELPADPAPSRRSRKGRRTAARSATRVKATRGEENQVRDALTMLYTLPAWGLQMRDPHCGGALMAQRDDIIKALTPIVCRNPAMLAWFTAANAPWMDVLALLQALLPVGQAVWGHHVTHTAGGDEQAGGGGLVDLSRYTA